jgi:hypothetical protein
LLIPGDLAGMRCGQGLRGGLGVTDSRALAAIMQSSAEG